VRKGKKQALRSGGKVLIIHGFKKLGKGGRRFRFTYVRNHEGFIYTCGSVATKKRRPDDVVNKLVGKQKKTKKFQGKLSIDEHGAPTGCSKLLGHSKMKGAGTWTYRCEELSQRGSRRSGGSAGGRTFTSTYGVRHNCEQKSPSRRNRKNAGAFSKVRRNLNRER